MNARTLKRILIAVAAVAALAGIAFAVVPSLIKVDPYVKTVAASAEAASGHKFLYDNAELSLFPPRISLSRPAVQNDETGTASYIIRADRLDLNVGFFDLLRGNIVLRSIDIANPIVELERFRDGTNNWSKLFSDSRNSGTLQQVRLEIENGRVILNDHTQDEPRRFDGLNGSLTLGTKSAVDIAVNIQTKPTRFRGSCDMENFTQLTDFTGDCKLSMLQEGFDLQYSGKVMATKEDTQWRGGITLSTKDIRSWLDLLFADAGVSSFTEALPELPVEAKGDVLLSSQQLALRLASLGIGASQGKFAMDYQSGGKPNIRVQGDWETLDLDSIVGTSSTAADGALFATPLGWNSKLSGSLSIKANKLTRHGTQFEKLNLEGDISGGELIISNSQATLPQGGRVVILGRIKSTARGLDYNGQVEAQGKSLAAILPFVGLQEKYVPKNLQTSYRARLNLYWHPKATMISELRLLTEDNIQISGGVNYYKEATPRLECGLLLNNFSFDQLDEIFIKKANMYTSPREMGYNPFSFDWLVGLNLRGRLSLQMNNFTVRGFKGTPSRMNIAVSDGKLQLTDVNVTLNDSRIIGQATVTRTASNPLPTIDTAINISRLNVEDLFLDTMYANERSARLSDSVWGTKQINFIPLHFFNGLQEIRIGELTHKTFVANNVRFKGFVQDKHMTVENLQADIWGGALQAQMQIDGAVVPSMDLSLSIVNTELREMLPTFVDFTGLSGLFSLNGKFEMSGINMHNWISNARASMSVKVINLFVSEFNLPAVIRSVASVRSVGGLTNAIRLALETGNSRFSTMEGGALINDGKLSMSTMSLRANESVGMLVGSADLVRWVSELNANFDFITLAQTNVPRLVVILSGSLDKPDQTLNTDSLESFVSRKNQ